MKKVVRLTEADLVRIVKRVIKEQGITGRNNPRWIKLFNVLRNIGSPKVLTFKDFDGNPSQSLNWGTTKTSNANYGLAASDAHESFYLMSDNKQLLSTLFKWWSNKGYKTDVRGGEVMINFDNVDKISSDLQNFFKSFSPAGKTSIQEQTSPSKYQINQVYEGIRVPAWKNGPQDLDSKNQKYTLTIAGVDGRDVTSNINGPGVYQGRNFPQKLALSISIPSEIANGIPNGLCGNSELGCFTQLKRIK